MPQKKRERMRVLSALAPPEICISPGRGKPTCSRFRHTRTFPDQAGEFRRTRKAGRRISRQCGNKKRRLHMQPPHTSVLRAHSSGNPTRRRKPDRRRRRRRAARAKPRSRPSTWRAVENPSNRPVMRPVSSTSMFSAAGFFGQPGHGHDVARQRHHEPGACRNLHIAHRDAEIARRPSLVWSSEKLYWVFAMHTGMPPKPRPSSCLISFFAAGVKSTPSAR